MMGRIDMFLSHLECIETGERVEAGRLATVSPAGMPLVARYDVEAVRGVLSRDTYAARRNGLWSLREMLPLADPAQAVTLGEGGTPLLPAPRLGRALGVASLLIKDEALNPTGSFKARGMSVAVSMARALGAKALAAPSASNAGGALAAYGARAALPVHLAMPEDVPRANRIEAEICGAEVTLVPGTIADCGRWVRERCEEGGWFDVSTLKEPYRVEGKKTMGYELAAQMGWRLPDVILYPTGGGTGLVGMWKAFAEMKELGWLEPDAPLPRMVVVQASGCAPIVEAFEQGRESSTAPKQPQTVAAGLRVPAPIGDRWMLRVLAESGGTALAVDDGVLLEGAREAARAEGLFVSPEGGALVAALAVLRESGFVRRSDSVVLFNTGTGVKYLECFER